MTRIDYNTFTPFRNETRTQAAEPDKEDFDNADEDKTRPMLYNTTQAAKVLGISRTLIYRLIKDQSLKSTMVYGRRVITPKAIKDFIEGLEP